MHIHVLSEIFRALIILTIFLVATLPKSYQHPQHQNRDNISRQDSASRFASKSDSPLDELEHSEHVSHEQTHRCRESSLAFYESCFQMSSELQGTTVNLEFITGFWEACSKLAVSNFKMCLISEI